MSGTRSQVDDDGGRGEGAREGGQLGQVGVVQPRVEGEADLLQLDQLIKLN